MRRILVLVSATALVLLPQVAAFAGIAAEFANGALTVDGTAEADDVVVGCEGGNVRVNGAPPSGGEIACAVVESITVRAGAGGDHVTLSGVVRSDFGVLADIDVLGEEGNDTLIGSALADRLDGGPGGDTLRSGDGADEL